MHTYCSIRFVARRHIQEGIGLYTGRFSAKEIIIDGAERRHFDDIGQAHKKFVVCKSASEYTRYTAGIFHIDDRVLAAQAGAIESGFEKFLQECKAQIDGQFKSIHRISWTFFKITDRSQVQLRIIYFMVGREGN